MFIHIVYNNTVKEEFKPFEGTISFIGPKADEWTYPSTMKLDELPEPQKSVYTGIAQAIQGDKQPWVASQIHVFPTTTKNGTKAVRLQIEAIHDTTNALRIFTPEDNPALLVEGEEAYSFFDYFTK